MNSGRRRGDLNDPLFLFFKEGYMDKERNKVWVDLNDVAEFCSKHDRCSTCEMKAFCETMGGGVMTFLNSFVSTKEILERNLLS